MIRGALREQVAEVLGPVVRAAGLDLEDVVVQAAGRRTMVRVVVDADEGVQLDDVAAVSRVASSALDAADLVDGTYVLEVTSPGVDRPLTVPRHWRRARGRLVEVSTAAGETVRARVADADDQGVALLGPDGSERRWPFAELGPGRVQVEFGRPEGPT